MTPVRVALVDDYEVVVRGLEAMLRTYSDRIQVVELDVNEPVAHSVDVALYDTFAGAPGDWSELRHLTDSAHVAHVVVYSWNFDSDVVGAAVGNGASGYLSKALPAADLVTALEQVHGGRQQIVGTERGPRAVMPGDWPGREEGLTPREAEVLALITQGLGNADIAERTHLSINSVKTYIRSAYRRIGVANRSNAVRWGVQHGFLPDYERLNRNR